jgi:hypothetical protein
MDNSIETLKSQIDYSTTVDLGAFLVRVSYVAFVDASCEGTIALSSSCVFNPVVFVCMLSPRKTAILA